MRLLGIKLCSLWAWTKYYFVKAKYHLALKREFRHLLELKTLGIEKKPFTNGAYRASLSPFVLRCRQQIP
jgi:hypothetical protein